ncbi:hypothetical protein M408DRAFT_43886, partial [Serendipita vermifera MAFF 305830]
MAGYTGDTKYTGPERIVVAMDIGTTMSKLGSRCLFHKKAAYSDIAAVSFAYLYPDDYTHASSFVIPPLPQGVPITQVYSDFFQYLTKNTQICFEQSIPNGSAVWSRLRNSFFFFF